MPTATRHIHPLRSRIRQARRRRQAVRGRRQQRDQMHKMPSQPRHHHIRRLRAQRGLPILRTRRLEGRTEVPAVPQAAGERAAYRRTCQRQHGEDRGLAGRVKKRVSCTKENEITTK